MFIQDLARLSGGMMNVSIGMTAPAKPGQEWKWNLEEP